jgi:hypothetical protein
MALTLHKVAILVALAAALPATALGQPEKPSTKQTEQATHALATWLESDDFEPYHLAPVTNFGQVVVPSLIAALERGPSPAKREVVRRSLEADYEALAERARSDPARRLRRKPEFMQHYLANFDARYRIRAAQALSAIGGASARKALEGSLEKAWRDDVRTAIRQALGEIK